jgi:hypothetical protein
MRPGHGWQEELKLMLNLTKPRTSSLPRRPQAPQACTPDLAESSASTATHLQRRNGLALEIDESGAASARTSTPA